MKHSHKYQCRRCSPRRGATLIDVAIGSMMLTLLLIPSVQMIGKTQSVNQRLDDRDTMLFEAEEIVETYKVKLSEPGSFDSVFSRPHDEVQKIVVVGGPVLLGRTQIFADTSLPTTKLLTIVVDVWRDTDADGRLSSGETSESLRTQWAAP